MRGSAHVAWKTRQRTPYVPSPLLYKGGLYTAGRKSPVSLYNPALATMEADPTQAYDQGDATGFIRLNALRLKVAAGQKKRRR